MLVLPLEWSPLFRTTAPAMNVGAALLTEVCGLLRAAGPLRKRLNSSRSSSPTRRGFRVALLYLYLLHTMALPPKEGSAEAAPEVFPLGHWIVRQK
jgi:hypothetical protein